MEDTLLALSVLFEFFIRVHALCFLPRRYNLETMLKVYSVRGVGVRANAANDRADMLRAQFWFRSCGLRHTVKAVGRRGPSQNRRTKA